ncbi:MAG: transposase [Bacteroidales bacterium]|jgi:transposase-like protein|nr:transposase [Bacteroidales bacterium]
MTKRKKTINRYSLCFKEKVVQEISSGSSISEVRRRYGINGNTTVQGWIKHFGREELLNKVVRIEMIGEKDRLKELESEVKKLKIALVEKTIALDAMETLVKIANRHYKTDIKKNLGQKQ